jgi:hypothetical protein
MKSFLHFLTITAALAACLAILPDDIPTPTPYEPTADPAQRVRDYIRGERDTLDESDLNAPSVPEPLRKAAQQIID